MSKIYSFQKVKQFFKKLGPGLITGFSDDDPSGIATYSQAGAQFGLATLWTALFTFPLMVCVQEMCARIGLVTGKGLAGNIKHYFSKPLLFFVILLMIPTLIVNIAANIASMGAATELIAPVLPGFLSSLVMSLILLMCMIFFSYSQMVSLLKYLCLTLLLYLIVPFFTHQDVFAVLKHTFFPTIYLNSEFIEVLVAILGTTISPYLFFWQATMSAETQKKDAASKKQTFSIAKKDVSLGMLGSNSIMYFIMLTTGTVLFNNGIHDISSVEEAAKALAPLAGRLSSILFSLGIIGAGFLSVPVLSACLSYIICTTFDCKGSLDASPKQAKIFYALIILSVFIGLALTALGFNPIKALIFSATLNCLISPPLLLVILWMSNNQKIMGKQTNGRMSNCFGIITFLLMSVCSALQLYFWLKTMLLG